jgi:SAM-dependent methyltransferase
MNKSPTQVRADFDRIALAAASGDEIEQLYDRTLINLIPRHCKHVLDLGCGTGRLTRAVAQRVDKVTAIDCSAEMLRVARQRSRAYENIVFLEADVLDLDLDPSAFDCVIAVNLLHHLPVEQAARVLKAAVAPAGLLIVHDLRRTAGMLDRVLDGPRLVRKVAWRLSRMNRVRAFFQQRTAWAHHARGDVVATRSEIKHMRDKHFEGAILRQHFLWRYTLLWGRPALALLRVAAKNPRAVTAALHGKRGAA